MDILKYFLLISFTCICVGAEKDVENRIIKIINQLDTEKHINLFGGLSIDKISTPRSFSGESSNLVDRISNYFETHELNFEILSDSTSKIGKHIQLLKCDIHVPHYLLYLSKQ